MEYMVLWRVILANGNHRKDVLNDAVCQGACCRAFTVVPFFRMLLFKNILIIQKIRRF